MNRPDLDIKKEQKIILPLVFISFLLFCLGFGFGVGLLRWLVVQLTQTFFQTEIANYWDVNIFISQILLTATILGLLFQFPILLIILVKLNLVKLKSLKKKRPLIIAGAFIFAALLPPTDAFSLIIMAFSLILLYELTIIYLNKTKGGE